jgi:hypothetical protein
VTKVRIACLHTAQSNVDVLEAAAAGLPVQLMHTVRAELLREAEIAGGLTRDIAARTAAVLDSLSKQGVDGVLLTCSTLGPAVRARAGADIPSDGSRAVPVLRVDEALAAHAVRQAAGGQIVILYAVETTREPTRALFAATPGAVPDRVALRRVEGAWTAFRSGDTDGYFRAIAMAADRAFDEGAAVVALAQASMAGAASLASKGMPLTSPAAGLAAMMAKGRGV